MEEVEILCDRIIILDKGKIIASGTKESLKTLISTKEKVTVEIDGLKDTIVSEIRKLKHVEDVIYDGEVLYITYREGKHNLSELIDYMKAKKLKYSKIFSEQPTLNDVFLELTGKELRD